MKNLIARFVREEEGQDLIEYALLGGLITVASVAVIITIGTGTLGLYNNLNAAVVSAS